MILKGTLQAGSTVQYSAVTHGQYKLHVNQFLSVHTQLQADNYLRDQELSETGGLFNEFMRNKVCTLLIRARLFAYTKLTPGDNIVIYI